MALTEISDNHSCVSPAGDPWAGWPDVMAEIHGRIAPRFARREVRERVSRYVLGLLERVERKNG